MVASILLAAVAQYMFSADGVTQGSGLRGLPSQGVSRSTGRVVVGLHGCTDAVRADCGWYRYTPVDRPDTNHYWKVTNYVFRAGGTVENVWTQYSPTPKAKQYSKASIIMNLLKLNGDGGDETKWDAVKAAIEAEGLTDLWNACTYIEADNPAFVAAKPRMMEILGMTEKQLDEFLDTCIY